MGHLSAVWRALHAPGCSSAWQGGRLALWAVGPPGVPVPCARNQGSLLGWVSTRTLGFRSGYSSRAVRESAGTMRLPCSLHSSFPQGSQSAWHFVSCLRNGGADTHGPGLLTNYRNGRVRGRKEAKPTGEWVIESLGGSERRSDHCGVQGHIPARCPRSPHRTPLVECQGTEQPAKHYLWPRSCREGPGPGKAVRLGVSGSAAGARGKIRALQQMPGRPTSLRAPWPFSVLSRRPLARPWELCHPESSHTHLDCVLPRLWQPVFGKLGEGGLGRG